jgi:hypothetical protein
MARMQQKTYSSLYKRISGSKAFNRKSKEMVLEFLKSKQSEGVGTARLVRIMNLMHQILGKKEFNLAKMDQQELQNIAVWIIENERAKGKKASSNKLIRLMAAERVLRTTQLIRSHEKTARNPTVLQVLGANAIIYGLNSQELKDTARKMHAMEVHESETITWEGTTANVSRVIVPIYVAHQNLPSAIYGIVSDTGRPVSSKEILTRLGKEPKFIEWCKINSSVQLLETMGLVQKLPHLTLGKKIFSLWIARGFDVPLSTYEVKGENGLHYNNTELELLALLQNGEKLRTELYKPSGRARGNTNAVYSGVGIRRACRRLESSGLVHTRNAQTIGTSKYFHRTRYFKTESLGLTELGGELWSNAIQTGILSKDLIKLLLGEKEVDGC